MKSYVWSSGKHPIQEILLSQPLKNTCSILIPITESLVLMHLPFQIYLCPYWFWSFINQNELHGSDNQWRSMQLSSQDKKMEIWLEKEAEQLTNQEAKGEPRRGAETVEAGLPNAAWSIVSQEDGRRINQEGNWVTTFLSFFIHSSLMGTGYFHILAVYPI